MFVVVCRCLLLFADVCCCLLMFVVAVVLSIDFSKTDCFTCKKKVWKIQTSEEKNNAFVLLAIAGVITLPTQTMHFYRANPSKLPYMCCLLPRTGDLMTPEISHIQLAGCLQIEPQEAPHLFSSSALLGINCQQILEIRKLHRVGWNLVPHGYIYTPEYLHIHIIEGSLNSKLPTIWTVEKQMRQAVKSEGRRCTSAKVTRKKIHPRQVLEKSRNAVFFQ